MAGRVAHSPPVDLFEDDFCLPGLEFQHELLLTLQDWASAACIVRRLADAGAELCALTLNPQGGGFILKCRVHAISASRARAFVADLGELNASAAAVEHLILAKSCDHARA